MQNLAVVTGASSGIGLELARYAVTWQLAQRGRAVGDRACNDAQAVAPPPAPASRPLAHSASVTSSHTSLPRPASTALAE